LFHAAIKGNDVAAALATVARERADAMFVAMETETFQNRRRIIDFAAGSRRPASYGQWSRACDSSS
jgi:hypothetical protein